MITYPYKESTDKQGRPVYYARWRTLKDCDGKPREVLTTRYTWQYANRPVSGPRGGKAYQCFARAVYYADGTFYKAQNFQDAEHHWFNGLAPITGSIWDAHPHFTGRKGDAPVADIVCQDGKPVSVTSAGALMWSPDLGIDYLEQLLHLDVRKRRSPAA